jgi:hypothetical protein
MKDLISQFTAAIANAPAESSLGLNLAEDRKALAPMPSKWVDRAQMHGDRSVVYFHERRRQSIADKLASVGAEKITFRQGTFTLTVWNTKETLEHLIKRARKP